MRKLHSKGYNLQSEGKEQGGKKFTSYCLGRRLIPKIYKEFPKLYPQNKRPGQKLATEMNRHITLDVVHVTNKYKKKYQHCQPLKKSKSKPY